MSRFNTGNPLGSGDPRDLDDNAKNMDLAVNSDELSWSDRFQQIRLTYAGMQQQFSLAQESRDSQFQADQEDRDIQFQADQLQRENEFDAAQDGREQRFNTFIASSGYQFAGDYAAGIEITEYNQLIRDSNGEFWRVSGQVELPYVTTGAGIPEDDALVPAGDAVLRQDLANPDKGAALVAYKDSTLPEFLSTTITRDQCGGLLPSSLEAVQIQVDANNTLPIVCDAIGERFYAYRAGRIFESLDAKTWVDLCNAPINNTMLGLRPTNDGEVLALVSAGVFKSSGWGGSSVTWTQKTFSNGIAAPQAFSFDGDGQKFIVAEYGPGSGQAWVDSRYAYISIDAGDTFYMAYDSDVVSGNTPEESHLHGVAYDPWNDTFYVSEGHGPGGGIYHSTDDGATWSLADGMKIGQAGSASPTTITATDDGLVCGSDGNSAQGVYGVVRTPDPMQQRLNYLWAWRPSRSGNNGWGAKQVRDPRTGMVYCAWKTQGVNVAPIITGGTPFSAGLVYEYPGTEFALDDVFEFLAINDQGILAARGVVGDRVTVTGIIPPPRANAPVDEGGVLGGSAPDGASIAGGRGAQANSIRSTAFGVNATASQDGVAVGHGSSSTSASATGIGSAASASGGNTTAVGYQSSASGGASVAIGSGASALASSVALGRNAKSSATSTSLGFGAEALIGSQSVAIGYNTKATGSYQVALGARHLEMTQAASFPAGPAPGSFRLAMGSYVFEGPVVVALVFAGSIKVPLATTQGTGADPIFSSSALPDAAAVGSGARVFNTTLGKPVWSNGTVWVDAMGTPI